MCKFPSWSLCKQWMFGVWESFPAPNPPIWAREMSEIRPSELDHMY